MTRGSGGNEATPFLVSLQSGGTTLSHDRNDVVSFDLEGRPQSWVVDGRTYKRSLTSEVFGRRSVEGVRRRWRVDAADARTHFGHAAKVAEAARSALAAGTLRRKVGAEKLRPLSDSEAAQLGRRLRAIDRWTPERLMAERQRFLATYEPVSILPPDQYGAIVLQATYGCSWNRCSFCTFYQDRPFQVRDVQTFEEHAAAVRDLLGAAASARTSVFLGDGNALVLSNARLEPLFRIAGRVFPGLPVASFIDVYGGERKSPDDWRQLAAWGLRRVAVGVETGSDRLLAYVNKPGRTDDAVALVTALKDAGLSVAVILMVGVGGKRFAEEHAGASEALLGRLPLGQGDLVYLSPFVLQPGSDYEARAQAEGLEALSSEARVEQYERLRAAARQAVPDATVALYHIDEFVY